MKCLEFLYFYLLDENAPDTQQAEDACAPTAPSSPTGTDAGSGRAHTRNALSMSQSSDSSVGSDASTSSAASRASASTSATSTSASTRDDDAPAGPAPLAASPVIRAARHRKAPSRNSSSDGGGSSGGTPARPLAFLRRDLDFVPQTPGGKYAPPSPPGSTPRGTAPADSEWKTPRRLPPRMTSLGAAGPPPCEPRTPVPLGRARGYRTQRADGQSAPASPSAPEWDAGAPGEVSAGNARAGRQGVRTMEEKRAILGSMMGNVDALVEGVKKAGIWGLG